MSLIVGFSPNNDRQLTINERGITMRFQYTPYVGILSVTAIISAIITLVVWQRRSTPERTCFAFMTISGTGYATVAALEGAAIAIPDKMFWGKLEYVGSGCVMTFFLMFAFYFTTQKDWQQFQHTALLWILPIFNVVLVATNEWHRLVWTAFLPGPQGSNLIVYQHGPGFFWVMICVYAYIITGTLLLVKAYVRPSPLYRRQSSSVLVGSLIPLLCSSLYMLKLTPPGLNITPMSFMLTGLVYFTSLFRFRIFDLIPVARDMLVESMSDGVLVLDQKKRIVDINPAAQSLFGVTAGCIGQSVDEVLAKWSLLVKCLNKEDSKLDMIIDGAVPRYVEIQISLLRDHRRHFTGYLVFLHDITQRHQIEIELRIANERLQNQLLEIELLHVKLQEQAIRDKLTGLFNRHYFEQTLPKELARARRLADSVAIVILDIDYFKQINDSFGHQAGDRMLQAFGHLLAIHNSFGRYCCIPHVGGNGG